MRGSSGRQYEPASTLDVGVETFLPIEFALSIDIQNIFLVLPT